ncbi:MAG TPA: hypothetical protein VGR02_06170 [Thermoanaerobaculia bacterium]|jgi:hypothetical protein|nr:hypothetical protein [Thermoanaerobaculia bacterium]
MNDLKDVLSRYAGATTAPSAPLGADETAEPPRKAAAATAIDRDALRQDLSRIRDENKLWFALCAGMAVVLFIASVVMTVLHVGEPGTIKTVLSAFGISSAGLIVLMFRFWRTKSYTEMLVVLAANMDAAAIKSVIGILARKL